MAPQPPKNADQLRREQEQMREENSEAILGGAEDETRRGEQAPVHQGQNDDEPGDGLERQEPIRRSPHDDMRSQIAARFRRVEEPEDERPFSGDFSDPENTVGELAQDLSDEEYDRQAAEREAAGGQQQPQRQAKKAQQQDGEQQLEYGDQPVTRIVRGKKVTKTVNEWLDDATRVTAGDSYLEETRRLLEDAKTMRAGRAAPDPQHPEDTDTRTEGHQPQGDDTTSQHPDTSITDLVSKLQFGDPEEVGQELQTYISNEVKKQAGKAATESAIQRAFDQDLARSKKALKSFADANQDLANDEIAAMAIERGMYQGYREDIKALGIDESQIPKDNATLANWHRFYRIHGYEVRDTTSLLNAAKDRFVKWRGNNGQSSSQRRKAPPTVQVNVDRDQRRMNIPVQPTRGVTPRRDAAPAASIEASRQNAFAQIARGRGQRQA